MITRIARKGTFTFKTNKMSTTKQRVKKIVQAKKKSVKQQAYENPDRDEDLKEYLNRKDFHSFELELLMEPDAGMEDEY
jgi:hypothetical protein